MLPRYLRPWGSRHFLTALRTDISSFSYDSRPHSWIFVWIQGQTLPPSSSTSVYKYRVFLWWMGLSPTVEILQKSHWYLQIKGVIPISSSIGNARRPGRVKIPLSAIHTPVHIEYNPRNLEAFTTDLTQRHLWNQIQESTQHLINIMNDRKFVEGGQDWLTFKWGTYLYFILAHSTYHMLIYSVHYSSE